MLPLYYCICKKKITYLCFHVFLNILYLTFSDCNKETIIKYFRFQHKKNFRISCKFKFWNETKNALNLCFRIFWARTKKIFSFRVIAQDKELFFNLRLACIKTSNLSFSFLFKTKSLFIFVLTVAKTAKGSSNSLQRKTIWKILRRAH